MPEGRDEISRKRPDFFLNARGEMFRSRVRGGHHLHFCIEIVHIVQRPRFGSFRDNGAAELQFAVMAREKMQRGVELARTAGFDARGHIAQGKTWHAICEAAEELGALTIVLGARGLPRIQSALLGGVSAAVRVHAKRPVLFVPSRHPSP